MKPLDSLYFQYISEREGLSVLNDNDAFISYKIVGDECFLSDMFIARDSRSSGKCREMIEKLSQLAKTLGAKVITANIHLADKRSNQTFRAAVAVGFELARAHNDSLLITKNLEA